MQVNEHRRNEIKLSPDAYRFSRYQKVLDLLLAKDGFQKSDVYDALKDEDKAFIGRVIGILLQEGYLSQRGPKTRPVYIWSGKKEDFDPGRWIDRRVFTATVKKSPTTDRPRERLLRLGAAELKAAELLAILIRSGVQGESAIQAGEKLSALFGTDLEKLSLKSRGELKQISPAIGETAYCQIMAALELGKRLAGQRQTQDSTPRPAIRNTADALSYCRDHFSRLARESRKEEFHVVLLDGKHHVIQSERVTVGLSNESLAHPREALGPAVRESASALILVHNHPSGDPTPSRDDQAITRELKQAAETLGLRILDHIILAGDKVLSMVDEGLF
jgi:DNA repair protein RadC